MSYSVFFCPSLLAAPAAAASPASPLAPLRAFFRGDGHILQNRVQFAEKKGKSVFPGNWFVDEDDLRGEAKVRRAAAPLVGRHVDGK